MLSKLLLASEKNSGRSGALQLYELYQLKLKRPRLVVLAACHTRGEEYFGGEGAIGISRPFEAAGIPLVIASLWRVDAAATAELMTAFHRFRKQPGQTTVEALRKAQLELSSRADGYSHPYYWAAFIAVGGNSNF